MACWRSASTITCEVISHPPAHSTGVATAHRTRSTRRIGTDSAWASADGGTADGAHGHEAGGVGLGSRPRRHRRSRPTARPAAVAPIQRSRRSGSIPPMPTWTAPSTAPPARPPMAAAPTASMLPATARAATPASGNPTKVPSHRAHRLDLEPVSAHRCLPSGVGAEFCPLATTVRGGHDAAADTRRTRRLVSSAKCQRPRSRWSMTDDGVDAMIRQAIGGDADAIAWVVAHADTIDHAVADRDGCPAGAAARPASTGPAPSRRRVGIGRSWRSPAPTWAASATWSTRWPGTTWSTTRTA